MSFDLLFRPYRLRDTPVEQKNPFTGQVQSFLPTEPLTPAEIAAVGRVLRQSAARGPDEYGCSVIELEDGGTAELFGEQLQEGCMVAVRGLTPALLQFLYALLRAADWVIVPVAADPVTIAASPVSLKVGPEIVICDSGEALGVLLQQGLVAWQRYRDQMARGLTGGT